MTNDSNMNAESTAELRESVQSAYSGKGTDYDTIRSDDAGNRLTAYDLSIVKAMLPFASTDDAMNLEVGCGTGRFTIPLLEMGFRTTATDINESLLSSLREKVASSKVFQENCIVRVENGFELSLGDGDVDGLLCVHVIGRFESDADQLALLKEFSRVLKPGGKLLFNFSNKSSMLYGKRYRNHLIAYDTIMGQLPSLGFSVVSTRGKWIVNGTLLRKVPSFLRPVVLGVDSLMQTILSSRSWDVFVLAQKD